MNFRNTLILFIIAVAVVVGVYLTEGRRDTAQDADKTSSGAQSVQVLDLKVADVTRLRVTDKDGKTVEAAREGSDWKLVAPSQAPGDTARLDGVVRQVVETRATRKLETKDANLADFGLDKPTATISLTTGAGEKTIKVGDQTPDKSAYYIQRADDGSVYTISTFAVSGAMGLAANPPLQPTPLPGLTVLPPEPTAAPTATPAASATPKP